MCVQPATCWYYWAERNDSTLGRAEEIFEKLKCDGEPAIDQFIEIRKSEELFLDFKRSADDGKGPKFLDQRDLNNLARAISGFGNSEGGVIIWGVDAAPDIDNADVAKAKRPIENVTRFVSWLEGTVFGRTIPSHVAVQNYAIDVGSGCGFVATLIPKSERAPHQAIPEQKYYMRAGSSFLPVPHGVLAGMFGQRPQPSLIHEFEVFSLPTTFDRPDGTHCISMSLKFHIRNNGPVIARDLYSDLQIGFPNRKSQVSYINNSPKEWTWRTPRDSWMSAITIEGYRLAPESLTTPFQLHLSFEPPFSSSKFALKWTYGCDGHPIQAVEIEHSPTEIEDMYQDFRNGAKGEEEGQLFMVKLFNRPMKT